MRCIGPRAKDADFRISIWEEPHRLHKEGTLVEVEHVKAHEGNPANLSLFEKLITEDNVKADELAKERTMLDGGDVAQVRSIPIQLEREQGFCGIV